jgi:hypothetical protein
MSRASRSAVFTAKRVFWGCAAFVLPAINPPIVLFGAGLGGLGFAAVASFLVLWFASERAWPDPRSRKTGLFWGMAVTIACSVAAAFVEFFVFLFIAAQSCPPDAYECPV